MAATYISRGRGTMGGGGGAFRRSTRLSVVAFTLFLGAGCDAVPPLMLQDASDASDNDAAVGPGEVTITILSAEDTPVQGVPVLFHNPNGTVNGEQMTGPDGSATRVIEPGSMVTVAFATPGDQSVSYELLTATGIMPGQDLVMRGERDDNIWIGDLKFQLPSTSAPQAVGVTGYEVHVGCERRDVQLGEETQPVQVGIYQECAHGSANTYDGLAIARGVRDRVLLYSVDFDLPQPSMDVGSLPVNNFPSWQNDAVLTNLVLTNTWDGMKALQSTLRAFRDNGSSYDLYSERDEVIPAAVGSQMTLEYYVPPDLFDDGLEWSVLAQYGSTTTTEGIVFYGQRLGPGDDLPNDFDLTEQRPPLLHDVEVNGANGEEVLTLTVEGDATTMDGLVTVYRWRLTDGQNMEHRWGWSVLLPPGTTTFTLPVLPPGFLVQPGSGNDAWPPPATAERTDDQVLFIDSSAVAGFAEFVQTFGGSILAGGEPEFGKGHTFRAVVSGFN